MTEAHVCVEMLQTVKWPELKPATSRSNATATATIILERNRKSVLKMIQFSWPKFTWMYMYDWMNRSLSHNLVNAIGKRSRDMKWAMTSIDWHVIDSCHLSFPVGRRHCSLQLFQFHRCRRILSALANRQPVTEESTSENIGTTQCRLEFWHRVLTGSVPSLGPANVALAWRKASHNNKTYVSLANLFSTLYHSTTDTNSRPSGANIF